MTKTTVNKKNWIMNNIKSLLVALVIALLIRSFIFQPFYIPSGSMKNTLLEGDYVLVSKWDYGYSNTALPFSLPLLPKSRIFYTAPQRGDVVVFKYQKDNKSDFVKRLIGLPGDKISVVNSVVYINDKPLKREFLREEVENGITFQIYKEYLSDSNKSYEIKQIKDYNNYQSQYFGPITLKENEFFLMGDNRDMSKDGRYDGPVPKSNLEGKVRVIFFSINGSFLQVWKWFSQTRVHRIFKLVK